MAYLVVTMKDGFSADRLSSSLLSGGRTTTNSFGKTVVCFENTFSAELDLSFNSLKNDSGILALQLLGGLTDPDQRHVVPGGRLGVPVSSMDDAFGTTNSYGSSSHGIPRSFMDGSNSSRFGAQDAKDPKLTQRAIQERNAKIFRGLDAPSKEGVEWFDEAGISQLFFDDGIARFLASADLPTTRTSTSPLSRLSLVTQSSEAFAAFIASVQKRVGNNKQYQKSFLNPVSQRQFGAALRSACTAENHQDAIELVGMLVAYLTPGQLAEALQGQSSKGAVAGYTALHYAARAGNADLCALLIAHGATQQDQPAKDGATPRTLAESKGIDFATLASMTVQSK